MEAAGVEVPTNTSEKAPFEPQGGAETGALKTDPLLALVVERWSSLSPQQRLAVIEAAIRPTP